MIYILNLHDDFCCVLLVLIEVWECCQHVFIISLTNVALFVEKVFLG